LRALLQKRPIILLIILVAATPYRKMLTPCIENFHSLELNRDYRCKKTVRVWLGRRKSQKNCYELDRKFLSLHKSCRRNTGVRIYWDVGGSRAIHRTEYSYILHIKHWYTLHRNSHHSTHITFVHPREKILLPCTKAAAGLCVSIRRKTFRKFVHPTQELPQKYRNGNTSRVGWEERITYRNSNTLHKTAGLWASTRRLRYRKFSQPSQELPQICSCLHVEYHIEISYALKKSCRRFFLATYIMIYKICKNPYTLHQRGRRFVRIYRTYTHANTHTHRQTLTHTQTQTHTHTAGTSSASHHTGIWWLQLVGSFKL